MTSTSPVLGEIDNAFERIASRRSSVYHGTDVRQGAMDDRGTYCKLIGAQCLRDTVIEFTDGNSWSSKINDGEKPAQLARLVIQLGCLDTVADSVERRTLTGWGPLTCQSGRTDRSTWTAILGLQKARSRADDASDRRQKCVCAPVFKRIKSSSARAP
jgi:hypothetical protein